MSPKDNAPLMILMFAVLIGIGLYLDWQWKKAIVKAAIRESAATAKP